MKFIERLIAAYRQPCEQMTNHEELWISAIIVVFMFSVAATCTPVVAV